MAFDYVNYYRLEYLQTGGTQRIDTGIQGYCEFEMDFQLTSPGTAGYNSFFGSRQDGATNRFGCFNYNGIFHFMTGTGNTWNIAVDTNRHLIHFNSSIFTDNGTEYPVSVPGGSYGTRNFWLMWCNGLSAGGNGYWYYAKFWDSNGTLIRDYIPAQRKSDNVLGMYDAVNDTFTVNSGSGSFTAGRIINKLEITPNPIDGGVVTVTKSFDFTGGIQTFTVPKSGNYKLEVYGGKGGGNSNETGYGGNGGYARGTKYLEKDTVLYIVCGGGNNNTYNGGGNGNRTAYSGNGGGATHIATVTGTLASIGASNIDKILIVAGGGGGGGYGGRIGGSGGGLSGGNASGGGSYIGLGASQVDGGACGGGIGDATKGSFGQGGSSEGGITSSAYDAGGGGGGLYGGGGGDWSTSGSANGAGGGGSGYIGNLVDGYAQNGQNNKGNGYAIITYVSEGELFPSGTNVTLEATPNRGYEFIDWELEGYTKLDYIESSGTQYIDTGLTIGSTFREECDCMILDTSGEKRQGCWNAGQSWGCNNGYMCVFGATASSRPVGSRYLVNVKYDTSNTTLTIDGQAMTTSSRTVTATQKYLLFASSYADGSPAGGTYLSMRMYEDKLWDSSTGGNLVRHFIPVIRNSDSKIGLLDLVEMKFYANAGTSEFNKFKESDTVTTPAFTYSSFSWASWVSTYGAGVDNNYITIDFQRPVVVVEYEGNNHNDSSSIAWSFTIAGSDDNVTYTNIQTDAWPAKAFQAVAVRNSTAYRYYRLIYSAYNNSYSSRRYVFANLSFSGYTEEETSSVILYDNPLTITLKDNLDLIANFEKTANCRYKVNGEWKQAMMYIKVNGQWIQGTPKIKVNGVWKDCI